MDFREDTNIQSITAIIISTLFFISITQMSEVIVVQKDRGMRD